MRSIATFAIVGIWVNAFLVWWTCLGASRHFMKMAGLVYDREAMSHLPADVLESRRHDMSAFQRAALFANLAGSAVIFLATVAALVFSAIVYR
jgi:hypothetical protein